MGLQVFDDFVDTYQFRSIESELMGSYFPWYYNDGIYNIPEPNRFQLIHGFYKPEVTPHSRWLSLFDGCQQKLGVKNLRRVKGNLTTRTVFHRRAGMHIDYPNMTTSILYVNTNNGGTRFKNGEFIKSVANRLITFDSNLEHEGVSCTDKKTRVVVNFNYEKY